MIEKPSSYSIPMNSNELIRLTQDIVHLRTIHNITQLEAATAINVSVGTLSRWESHNFRSTKLSHLINLINYLESRGVNFGDTKGISAYKTQTQTTGTVKQIRQNDTFPRRLQRMAE